MNEQYIQTTIRAFVKAALGGLIAKGIADDSGIEIIASAVGLIASIVWGILEKKQTIKNASQSVSTNVNSATETK
jgi:outer membrane lipoprotein SlyB